MKDDYFAIKDYLELHHENKKIHSLYIPFFFVLIIGILCFFKVDTFYKTDGYVLEDLIVLTVNTKDLNKITQGCYLYITNKKYKYYIYDIEEEIIDYGNNYYKRVRIEVNLDDQLNYDYNVVQLKFEQKKTSFYKILSKKIMEGL